MGNMMSSTANYSKINETNSSSTYDLQVQIIRYFSVLSSQEQHFRDPNDVFRQQINELGFSNLHDFIHSIPKEIVLENFIIAPQKREPEVQQGQRYVVKKYPVQRGSVVGTSTGFVENGHATLLVHLQLDKPTSIFWRVLQNCLWFLPSFRLLRAFQLNELQLENEYLKSIFLAKCVSPCSKLSRNKDVVGIRRGIEGANNSCYMDSLLFSMFYRSPSFDIILVQKPSDSDDTFAMKTRKILRDHVVNPLRNKLFCSADQVMKLRNHLQNVNDDIMGSFMDVEELLYLLLQDVLKEKEFIKYDEGGEDFMHLMQIDNDDSSKVITVQNNFETSMKINGDLKFACVPSPVLILGLPRSNGKLVHYDAVIPNLELDIEKYFKPESCNYCKKLALWELSDESGSYTICPSCVDKCSSKNLLISRQFMRLQSVICISASHFVAFVRNGGTNQWLFFDSMAGGYPEVKIAKQFEKLLISVGNKSIKYDNNDKISPLMQRVFTDGHFCIYEPVKFKK